MGFVNASLMTHKNWAASSDGMLLVPRAELNPIVGFESGVHLSGGAALGAISLVSRTAERSISIGSDKLPPPWLLRQRENAGNKARQRLFWRLESVGRE